MSQGHPRSTAAEVVYILPKPRFFQGVLGGAISHAIGVANGLVAAGASVRVISGPGLLGYRDRFSGDVRLEEIPQPRFPDPGDLRWTKKLRARIDEIIEKERTMAVMARYAVSTGLWMRPTMRGGSGGPLRIFEVNSIGYHHRKFRWIPERLRRSFLPVEKATLRHADLAYVVSAALREQLVAPPSALDPRDVVVIPNACPAAVAELARRLRPGPEEPARPAEGLRFVYLGAFKRYYDYDLVIDGFSRVRREWPQAELHFRGTGFPRGFRAAASAVPGVRVEGQYSLEELLESGELAAPTVFLLPYSGDPLSRIGSPVKLFEYMAIGHPVLAANVGQVAEYVEPGVTGYLYEPGDVSSVTEGMRRFLEEPAARARMGMASRAAFEEGHTWEDRMAGLLEIITARLES